MSVSYYYLPAAETGQPQATSIAGELLNVAVAINHGNSAEQIVDLLFTTLSQFVPYNRIGLALVAPEGKLRLVHLRSTEPVVWGVGSEDRLAGSSLELILRDHQIRIINDLEAYYREHPGSYTAPKMLEEGIRSSLTLPLVASKGPIGVLFFSSTQPQVYRHEHVELLGAIAAGIGIALERAELVDHLRRANEDLRSLDRLKNNFLSNLSHELRTPLTRVLSYADSLEEEIAGPLTQVQHTYMQEVISGAARLHELLNQLFDMTALESGGFSLDRVPVDLLAIAKEVAGNFAHGPGRLAKPKLRLVNEFPPGKLLVEADPPRLAQAITELLENAYKFSPETGDVTLKAGSKGGVAWLSVKDEGIGIPQAYQTRVFDKFFQFDAEANRPFNGAGLGLALVKGIVEAHGGSVCAESEPGHGSLFRIALPLAQKEP